MGGIIQPQPVTRPGALHSFLSPHPPQGNLFAPAQPAAPTPDARKAFYLDTVAKVRGGQMNEQDGAKRLEAAGFPAHDNPFVPDAGGGTGNVLHAVAGHLGLSRSDNIRRAAANDAEWMQSHQDWTRAHPVEAAAGAVPLGAVAANRAGGVVVPGFGLLAQIAGGVAQHSVNQPGGVEQGIVHPLRTAEHFGKGIVNTVEHPGADPAQTAFLTWALLSGLGSGAARGMGARGGFNAAEGGTGAKLRAALTRPGHEGGSILHPPEPGTQRIYAPGGAPEAVAGPLEQAQARVEAHTGQLAENGNRHQAAGLPVREDISDLEKQRQAMHDIGQRQPPPELNMAIRLGRERARIQANLKAAEADVEHHTLEQSGLSRTETAQGPRAAIHVDRILPRNVVARQFSKARNGRIQKALLNDQPTTARTAVGKAYREIFSPESTFGREQRAQGRVDAAGAAAPITQLSHATEGIISHGLSRGEHTAVGVVGVEGHRAFGTAGETPAQVIGRHVAAHQKFIDEGKGVEANEQHIADLRMAQQHLENPSPRFMRAVELSRRVSNKTRDDLIAHKMLNAETEARRRANIASMYHGDRYNPPTPGKEGVSPTLDANQARVDRLQKAYDALEAKGHRGGYTVAERPKTPEEAQQRFDELDTKLTKLRADMSEKMFGDKLSPEERAIQNERNKQSGIANRERLGLTRTGMQAKKVDDQLAAERSRLADLEQRHTEKPSESLAGRIKTSRTKIADLETRKLSFNGKRLKRVDYKKRGLEPGKPAPNRLVRDDRHKAVEAELDKIIDEHKTEPWAQELRSQIDEHDALTSALAPRASFMDEPPPDFGTVAASKYIRTTGTLERIGGATSVAKDDLEAAAKRAANRVENTGFADHGEPPEGSFFFPLSRRYTDPTPKIGPSHARTGLGEYGMSPADESGIVSSHPFSGKSVEEARGLGSVARSIATRGSNVNRLLATKNLYSRMWTAASPARRSQFDVPIRYGKEIQGDLRDFFSKLGDQLHATPDEELKLNASELERLTSLLSPDDLGHVANGATVPGVRWVDSRFLKSNGEISVRTPLDKLADAINNPVRATQLYARPAYILNLLGNMGMQGVTEGARVFPSMRRAVTAVKQDGADNAALIDGYLGSSRSRNYAVTTGPGHELNRRLAEGWNLITDMYSRRSAFYTEAARVAGAKTPAQIDALLHDPAMKDKLNEVVRRANKNIVDYDSLTPLEKNTIRRIIYFEPWVTRGTLWALRAIVENPAKAYTMEELGKIGAENAHKAFGDQPQWAKILGLIPVGKPHGVAGDLQGVLNPSSINTPSTAVQLGEAIAHPLNKDVGLSNLITPAYGTGISLFGSGAGDTKPQGVFKDLHGWLGPLGSILESLPPVQAVRRSGVAPGFAGGPSKTYPGEGVGDALGPYVAGGLYKRDISLSAMHAQAEKQKPVDVRAADRVQHEQSTLLSEARRVKLLNPGEQLPPDVVKAYTIDEQRKVAYAKLGANATQQQRLEADVELGVKLGVITAAEASEWVAKGKANPGDVAKARRWINDHRFGGKLLTQARTAVRKHGGDLHPVAP